MQFKHLAVAACCSLAVTPAFAGDWYVSGSIGQSRTSEEKSNIDAALTAAGATNLSSSLSNSNTAYKLQLGYQFTPNLAVEGGWVDLGKENYNATFTGGGASASAKFSGWNIAGVGTWPINDQFAVFGKLGAIDAKVQANVAATGPGGTASGSVSSTNLKANYGLGVSYNFTKQWAVKGELERFAKLGNSSTTGQTDVDLLSVGVVYKF